MAGSLSGSVRGMIMSCELWVLSYELIVWLATVNALCDWFIAIGDCWLMHLRCGFLSHTKFTKYTKSRIVNSRAHPDDL